MFETLIEKQRQLKGRFANCQDNDAKYALIIQLGREAERLDPQFKVAERQVRGCQSVMHLYSRIEGGRIYFTAESDALISNGLAALLTMIYSGEVPEAIFKCPPDYLNELGISASLSPSRANGLASIFLRMKQDALALIANSSDIKF